MNGLLLNFQQTKIYLLRNKRSPTSYREVERKLKADLKIVVFLCGKLYRLFDMVNRRISHQLGNHKSHKWRSINSFDFTGTIKKRNSRSVLKTGIRAVHIEYHWEIRRLFFVEEAYRTLTSQNSNLAPYIIRCE